MLTQAHTHQHNHQPPELLEDWLAEGDNSGLICLSGAHMGEVGSQLMLGHDDAAQIAAQNTPLGSQRVLFGNYKGCLKNQNGKLMFQAAEIAAKLDLPVVATHAAQFLQPNDFLAHDTRVCIANGWTLTDPKRPREFVASQYFYSTR